MSEPYVANVKAALSPHADPFQAAKMEAYMKDHFPFLGVPAPFRRSATKQLPKQSPALVPRIARALWEQEEREYQYVAVDMLEKAAKTLDPGPTLAMIEELAQAKSWWDSVDGLAGIASNILRRNPEHRGIVENWSAHSNFWINRLAILHQKSWRSETDSALLFRLCLAHAANPEFFVRKAIGWALRDYAWVEPDAVRAFVEKHCDRLSALSNREALKNIGKVSAIGEVN